MAQLAEPEVPFSLRPRYRDDVITSFIQDRILAQARSPFSHADQPLARTLTYEGDPGICGPSSATWPIIGDVAAFVGGIRGLVIQAAHPEVVAGVSDHSTYLSDPLGRLSRTSSYVTHTSFGAMPEVEASIEHVRRAHRPVQGTSHRGKSYSAGRPGHAAWVHNTLTDSFVAAYRAFGPVPLSDQEADRFVVEQGKIGALLDAKPIPTSAAELSDWTTNHPEVAPSPGMKEVIDFLLDPPLPAAQKAGYKALLGAAITTIPPRLLDVLGISSKPTYKPVGKAAVRTLRWAMGNSPSWNLAMLRSGVAIPDGMFKQELLVSHAHRN